MARRLFLLVVFGWLLAATSAAHSQMPAGRLSQSQRQPARQAADEHEQGVRQRRSQEQVESKPHGGSVDLAEPDWEYRSPEDADILEGWRDIPPGGAPAPGPGEIRLSDRARAWELYRRGDYPAAAGLFSKAMGTADRQESLNARLGLAYTLLKQGNPDAAIPHLDHLVREGYRAVETRTALVQALAKTGRWDEARLQASRLPAKDRTAWERRIAEARLLQAYRNLPVGAEMDALTAFLKDHEHAVSACLRPDVFHALASRLKEEGSPQKSAEVNRGLLGCDLPPDLRLGILAELADTLPEDEALALLQAEKDRLHRLSPEQTASLEALEMRLLKQRLASLPADSPAKRRAAEDVLKLAPEDRDAQAALAWHAFEAKEYAESKRIFSRLWEQEPGNRDYALGLGYSRLHSGELDSALIPLDRGRIADDAETVDFRKLVLRRQATEAIDREDHDEAGAKLEAVIALDSSDLEAKELLAWTRYRQQRSPEAERLLAEVFAERPSPGVAGGLLSLYSAAGDEDRAYDLAWELTRRPDPSLRSAPAAFFFEHGAPITAAQLDRDPERCYFNADSPRADGFLYHRSKQGEGKFGDLEETALPITLIYPTELGKQWSAAVTPKYLAGNAGPARPQAGRFFRFLNGAPKRQNLEDSLFVVQPEAAFEMEGRLHTELHLGTTPLNGPVDPTPTFEARLGSPGAYVDLHRCNVKDSILSYVGQKDPYSSAEWGRVTRNGIEAGKNWPLGSEWWVGGSAGLDYYLGEHVQDNQAVHLDTAAGRTLRIGQDEFTYGLFFSIQHFRRNSDFYTYGHGGYYSPELMTILGPFLRYRTALCRDTWLDFQGSAGWLHQSLDRSPFYPLFDGNTTGFTPAASAEVNGVYDSDTDDKLGFNLKLQGMKLVTPHLAAGGFADINNTTDYTEWVVGAGIQIFFEPQNLFWTRKDMFREFGRCANK